jgi:hypothetical protein
VALLQPQQLQQLYAGSGGPAMPQTVG